MLVKCATCGGGMAQSAKHCPNCGAAPPTPKMEQFVYVVLLIILVVGSVYVMSGQ